MAQINDRFQLTNYGSEVQKAIDDALITIPQELALKAYIDQVLVKNQVIPYTPSAPYHPATKLYVDNANDTTNTRIDDEIARAKAAEKLLNEKHVLIDNNGTYQYIDLSTLDNASNSLVSETALDAKLGELSLGFFVFYQVTPTGELVEASKSTAGSNPYAVVNTTADLPTTDVPANALGLVLKDDTSINVYQYASSAWSILSTPEIQNGWLFASEFNDKGYYWFQNTWNLIDMNVDMSQYYKKTEIDSMLTGYVQKVTLGDPDDLTTTDKDTIVNAINSVQSLADSKDTLASIAAKSVLGNADVAGKPTTGISYDTAATSLALAQRTASGSIKAAVATDDDDVTTLAQVNSLLNNLSLDGYQTIIDAGVANNIIAYSGTVGQLNTLNRVTMINSVLANTTDMNIPTEKATATYVQNYKPIIITQGNSNTSVTTNQLTFWIEN